MNARVDPTLLPALEPTATASGADALTAKPPTPRRIVLILKNGVLENAVSDEPLEVCVVDYEIEGLPKKMIRRPYGVDAQVLRWWADEDPAQVAQAWSTEISG